MNYSVRNILILAFNGAIAEHVNTLIRMPQELPPPTDYVKAILSAATQRQRHIVVNALAGSGKTTAIMAIAAQYPEASKRAATLNSFGHGAISFHVKKVTGQNIRFDNGKVGIILRQLTKFEQLNADDQSIVAQKIGAADRLIALMKAWGFIAIRPEATDEDMYGLCDRYDVTLPDPVDTGISAEEVFELARRGLIANNNQINIIDYNDQVYLPVLLKVSFLWNDLILVDESQDLNPIQIALVKRAANTRAQVIFVGDTNQAIYGFRGADVEAIQSITELFDAESLPLSTCWRCPTSVIAEAQTIVPEIEAAPNAIEGLVDTIYESKMLTDAQAGDFVLCRTTAPLVDACMRFIRSGRAATVRGRDIGQGLELLCDKIKRRRSCKGKGLLDALHTYREEMLAKLSHPSKESQHQSLSDKLDTLSVLSEECDTLDQLKDKIRAIFKDVEQGDTENLILCSTAHRAKGLEAERVYIIHPELMPHPMARQEWQRKQESNLKYVAITRATRELHWVLENPKNGSSVTQDKPEATPVPEVEPATNGKPKVKLAAKKVKVETKVKKTAKIKAK